MLPNSIFCLSLILWHRLLSGTLLLVFLQFSWFPLHFPSQHIYIYIFFWFQLLLLSGLFCYKSLDCKSLLANFQFMARCSLLMFLFVMKNSTSPSCLQWRKKRHYLYHQNSSLSLLWRASFSFLWVLTKQRFHLLPLFSLLYLQNLTRLVHPLSRCVNASLFWILPSALNNTSSVSHLCRFILINDHWWQLGVFLTVWFSLNLS